MMVVPKVEEEKLVFDKRLSSVVPGKITGENKTYELKGVDLALKLHYIKGLYFFTNTNNSNNSVSSEQQNISATKGLISILEIKKPMFDWLISYVMACGRIRLSSDETGDKRPSIKLNDAGIRIVEARSSMTVEEWLAMENFASFNHHLVYDNALGPEVPFSPLVCIQVTWFRCGGISMGLSWAHILGDGFSASDFMNMLGQYLQGHFQQPKPLILEDHPQSKYPPSDPAQEPISVKRVNPVDNHWVLPTNCKIGTHTFLLTPEKLCQLHSRVHNSERNEISTSQSSFEVITAIMWKSIAKIRNDLVTKCVTICRPKTTKRQHVRPYNGQVFGTIEANFSIIGNNPLKLMRLVDESIVDESDKVDELVNNEMGKFDFFVYGANLTFVDMEKADVYGFELKGRFPRFASYTIDKVGENGVVLVLPGPKGDNKGGNESNDSKLIVVLLPENEIEPLKHELKEVWCVE